MTSVGRRGGGPGDIQSLEWVARFGSDSILALDVVSHRVSYFDIDGRFGRSVRLEPSAEIGEDYLLGLRRDELDVEYVELYELIR